MHVWGKLEAERLERQMSIVSSMWENRVMHVNSGVESSRGYQILRFTVPARGEHMSIAGLMYAGALGYDAGVLLSLMRGETVWNFRI